MGNNNYKWINKKRIEINDSHKLRNTVWSMHFERELHKNGSATKNTACCCFFLLLGIYDIVDGREMFSVKIQSLHKDKEEQINW